MRKVHSFCRWRCLVKVCFFFCVLVSLSPLIYRRVSIFSYNYKQQKRMPNFTCPSTRKTIAEDVLCLERKTFVKNFKNPCWLEKETHGVNSSYKNGVLRCLPYFHLFGVCKSGTTDLFSRLTQHPQILENLGDLHKETTFWSWGRYGKNGHPGHANVKETLYNFTQFFNAEKIGETQLLLEDMTEYSNVITGHADPMDFWDHSDWREIPQNDPTADVPTFITPHLVKHVQPNVKLILMLRQPAERLYSHYYHGKYGDSAKSFHNDVVKEIELLKNCTGNYSYRACLYGRNMTQKHHVPLTASLYYLHLQEWLEVFPLKQIFVFRNEDYQKDMKYTFQRLFQFLEVDTIPTKVFNSTLTIKRKYVTKRKVKEGSMLKETWDILDVFFKDWNKKLALLLNDDRYLWNDTPYMFKPAKKEKENKPKINRLQFSNKTELRTTMIKNTSLTKKDTSKTSLKQVKSNKNQPKASNERKVTAAEKRLSEQHSKDAKRATVKVTKLKTTLHHRQTTLPKPKKKVLKKDGIDQTKTVKTQTSMKKTKEKPRVNKKNGEITLRKAEEGKVKNTIAVLQEKGFLL